MQTALRAHPPTLLTVGVVAALLVAESSCVSPQQSVQRIIDKDLGNSDELMLSMVLNQVAVLKLLNESSTICSLHEKELQERLNRTNDLDLKTQEVKNDLDEAKEAALLQIKNEIQAAKEAAILELKNMTMTAMNEAKALLAEVKEAALSVPRQVPFMLSQDCESGWTKYQLSCYKVFETQVTHADATARCGALHSHLATIGSEGENAFVHGLISRNTFIGVDDIQEEGVWTWVDGSPFSYSKWGSGEPNTPRYDCVVLHVNSNWYDVPCTARPHYICEKRLE